MDICLSRPSLPSAKIKKKSKKNKREGFEKTYGLSPLLRTKNSIDDEWISGDDDDDDDDDENDFDRSKVKAGCLRLVVCTFRKCLRRMGYCSSDEADDQDQKREDACFKLRQFSERLDGVNRMLNEKIEEVQNKLSDLNERCNHSADEILKCSAKGAINNIGKIDLVSIMKEIDVYSRQYEFFNNIKVNLMKLRANTDVHAFSDTVKDALSLIPSNMRRIKSEKEFSLATRYSDALDDFANRMELPLNTVELQKIDLNESYEIQLEALLREREMSRSPKVLEFSVGDPGIKIEPRVRTSPRRNPVLLN